MKEWEEYIGHENLCLTFSESSPPSLPVLETDNSFWVKAKLAQSKKSLTVLNLEYETIEDDEDSIIEVMTRFEEL